MNYIDFINQTLKKEILSKENVVLFGQNVTTGSCISGFTKGMETNSTGRIINSTNSENALCGMGFGLMLSGANGIFFMKQLDFLLLGIDQLTDTYNIIRNLPKLPDGSFTIMPVIVDIGFQGPQSSLNNFADFCSIARIPGYTLTNKIDAEEILNNKMILPGFRIIAVSQRLFKEEIISPEKLIYKNNDLTLFQYDDGNDATIVSFNFSFPQAWAIRNAIKEKGMNSSLFNVNGMTPIDWEKIVENIAKTGKLIVLDDSKSENLPLYSLVAEAEIKAKPKKVIILKRELDSDWLTPNPDQLDIDVNKVLAEI
ncbi:hypothetical protein HYT00_03115 [Candidatus Giovannonibacteria bacterium]|nr:hypothetical protein [Candidatus Giovannonibacteria bacterium]